MDTLSIFVIVFQVLTIIGSATYGLEPHIETLFFLDDYFKLIFVISAAFSIYGIVDYAQCKKNKQ